MFSLCAYVLVGAYDRTVEREVSDLAVSGLIMDRLLGHGYIVEVLTLNSDNVMIIRNLVF